MPPITVDSLDDARLAPYRNLKDVELRRVDGRLIAEGRNVVLRLLASRYVTDSVLCSPRLVDALFPKVPSDVPVYVVPDREIDRVVGFKFHNGCLACGRAPAIDTVASLLMRLTNQERAMLVVAHELNNAENLGAIARIAAGFGAAGLILGPRTADPFYRQAIRVSMGSVFSLDLASSDNLVDDLAILGSHRFETIATVTDADAEPLAGVGRLRRCAVVVGSEAHGLDTGTIDACSKRITIPMKFGTDSLNVAIATAVILYELTRSEL